MSDLRVRGPWRQDELEPRIVLDGDGEFFAIGISAAGAAWIVAAMNVQDQAREEPSPGYFEPRSRASRTTSDH
jgi:hypothetical protein